MRWSWLLALLPLGCGSLFGLSPPPSPSSRCGRTLAREPRTVTRQAAQPADIDEQVRRAGEGYAPYSPRSFPRSVAQGFAKMPTRELPKVDGKLVVCMVQALSAGGVDAIHVPSIGTWMGAPDLRVEVTANGERHIPTTGMNSHTVLTTFRGHFGADDELRFEVEDSDLFSPNDPIGVAAVRYDGQMPILLQTKSLAIECRVPSAAQTTAEVAAAEVLLARHLDAVRDFTPSYPDNPRPPPVPEIAGDALRSLEVWTGDRQRVITWRERFRDATSFHRKAYLAWLQRQFDDAPPPGTWVSLGDDFDARIPGLICFDVYGAPKCNVELEVRLKRDADMCPVNLYRVGELGHARGYFLHGLSARMLVGDVFQAQQQVLLEQALTGRRRGDRLSISLSVAGYLPSKEGDHRSWEVAMVGVRGAMLRVY